MANNAFYNYRLYRTTPKLSGNMKWDIVLSQPDNKNKVWVRDFHLRPIADSIPYKLDVTENLLVRSHQHNIKKFREDTLSNFFNYPINPSLSSDWPWILTENNIGLDSRKEKYIKNWDDTYCSGTQRMSYNLYNTTHEMLIPLWLEQCQGLKIKIHITSPQPDKNNRFNSIHEMELDLSPSALIDPKVPRYHKRFLRYFINYLKDTGIYEGCNDVLYADFDKRYVTVRGVDVKSGNIMTRIDNSIVRNLMFRERPLLEQNSILTNIFKTHDMITPNLINFNLCFNFNNIMNAVLKDSYGVIPTLRVYPEVDFYAAGGRVVEESKEWITESKRYTTTVRDLFTNHEVVYNNFGDNILDYMKDYSITDMMHQNKMVAPIPHWMIANSNFTLFNTYKGSYDPQSLISDNWHDWASITYGDGYTIDKILNHPEEYIASGYLQDTNGYMNGIKVTWEDPEKKVDKLFVGLMTTDPNQSLDYFDYKTALTAMVSNKNYVAILKHAWDDYGNLVYSKTDDGFQYMDIESYSKQKYFADGLNWDADEYGARNLINSICLFICWKRFEYNGKPAVAVIFWTPSIDRDKTSFKKPEGKFDYWQKIVPMQKYNIEYYGEDQIEKFNELGIMSLSNTIKNYMMRVSPEGNVENFPYGDENDKNYIFKYIDNIEGLFGHILNVNSRQLIVFDNTLGLCQDDTLSINSNENMLFKIEGNDSYIRRYPSHIVPAMTPIQVPGWEWIERENGDEKLREYVNTIFNDYKSKLMADKYRHNYFYSKDCLLAIGLKPLKSDIEYVDECDRLLKYVRTGVPPKYPSLNYDPIESINNPNNQPQELDYMNFPNETYAHLPEAKWFDRSTICLMPNKRSIPSFEPGLKTNSKEVLQNETLEMFKKRYLGGDGNGYAEFDMDYLGKIYCLDYYLEETKPQVDPETGEYMKDPETEEILYRYKYSVVAHLK